MEFTTPGVRLGQQIAPHGIRFSRVPILGNAGAKIDAVLDTLLSPNVNDPKVPVPLEKKILEGVGVAPVVEAKALIDFLLGSNARLNPAGAELRRIRINPAGVLTPEQLARLQALGLSVQMTETWRADP